MNSIPFGNLDVLRQAPYLLYQTSMNKVTPTEPSRMEGLREGMGKKKKEQNG